MALAGLGVWRACWMPQHRVRRRDPVREWAAVVCALVLLFFAVSLSDDLHASLALLEESAAAYRRHSGGWGLLIPAQTTRRKRQAKRPLCPRMRFSFPCSPILFRFGWRIQETQPWLKAILISDVRLLTTSL